MGSKTISCFSLFKLFLLVWSVGLTTAGNYNSNGTLEDTRKGWGSLRLNPGFTGKSDLMVTSGRFLPSHSIKHKKFRTRMVESQANEAQNNQAEDNGNNGYPPIIMTYGPPIPTPLARNPNPSFMDVDDIMDSKDAALIGFGIGLAIGLGALGSIGSVLKFIIIPILAVSALLPLLLLLIIPINIITTAGQPVSSRAPRVKVDSLAVKLEKMLHEIVKTLPDMTKPFALNAVPKKLMPNSTKLG